MGDKSKIEWTEATWNPTVGCSVISPGCTNCYAMKMAARIELMSQSKIPRRGGRPKPTHYIGTTQPSKAGPVWTGKLALAPDDILLKPLSWKRPRMIFVNSMSDLFHESVPDEWIDRVFAVMALCPQHTFQVLTKRAERMRAYCSTLGKHWTEDRVSLVVIEMAKAGLVSGKAHFWYDLRGPHFVMPNVWLGVSAEDQKRADERIPCLLQTPAAVRFVSAEPLLGPIDFRRVDLPGGDEEMFPLGVPSDRDDCGPMPRLDWIIVGGESGPNARPMHPDWARSIRDQCAAAGVPYFFKQWGEFHPGDQISNRQQIGAKGDMGRALRDHHAIDLGDMWSWRIGKRAAGRLLDGREHNEMPERANG